MTTPSNSGSSLPEQDQRGQRLSLSRRLTGDPVSLALGLALARSLLNLDGILAMVMDLINWLSGPLQDREESHSGSSRRVFWNNDPCALFWLHLPKASFPKASCLLPSTVLFYLLANKNARPSSHANKKLPPPPPPRGERGQQPLLLTTC